jgi:amidase
MGYIHGLPVGVSFFGSGWSESTLIKFAYAFEHATHARKPPTFAAHVE